jgi:hypothetical protein
MGRVWDLSISRSNHLLAARDRNRIFVAKINGTDSLDLSGRFEFGLLPSVEGARLEQIGFNPRNDECFSVRDTRSVQIWNLEAKKCTPVTTILRLADGEGKTGITKWNPHDSNMIACLNENKGFALFDIRSKTTLYKQDLEISLQSKLQWSPFIPYWMAVSTDDGVSVFDLRYTGSKPAAFMPMLCPNDVLLKTLLVKFVAGMV